MWTGYAIMAVAVVIGRVMGDDRPDAVTTVLFVVVNVGYVLTVLQERLDGRRFAFVVAQRMLRRRTRAKLCCHIRGWWRR